MLLYLHTCTSFNSLKTSKYSGKVFRTALKSGGDGDVQSEVEKAVLRARKNRENPIDEFSSDFYVCIHTPELKIASKPSDSSVSLENVSRMNKVAAVASSLFGALVFWLQTSNPINGVTILHAMEADSIPIAQAICNGKPTVIDFYADWCESCKVMAPTMRQMEVMYGDRINFIAVDGTNPKNTALVDRFRVDGIPHVAMMLPSTEVRTSLIGALPKQVVEEEIAALAKGGDLPYEGMDPFAGESHFALGESVQAKYCPTATQ